MEKELLPGKLFQGVLVGCKLVKFLVRLAYGFLVINLLPVLPAELLEVTVPGNKIVGIEEEYPYQERSRNYEVLVLQYLEHLPESGLFT